MSLQGLSNTNPCWRTRGLACVLAHGEQDVCLGRGLRLQTECLGGPQTRGLPLGQRDVKGEGARPIDQDAQGNLETPDKTT